MKKHDVIDGFLIGLRHQKILRHPSASSNFVDTIDINKGSNVLLRDIGLVRSIIDVATCDGGCVASINITFISDYGKAYTARIEDFPMTLN